MAVNVSSKICFPSVLLSQNNKIYRTTPSYTVLNRTADKTRDDSGSITPNRRQK